MFIAKNKRKILNKIARIEIMTIKIRLFSEVTNTFDSIFGFLIHLHRWKMIKRNGNCH